MNRLSGRKILIAILALLGAWFIVATASLNVAAFRSLSGHP
jgi:hypothetical protein